MLSGPSTEIPARVSSCGWLLPLFGGSPGAATAGDDHGDGFHWDWEGELFALGGRENRPPL